MAVRLRLDDIFHDLGSGILDPRDPNVWCLYAVHRCHTWTIMKDPLVGMKGSVMKLSWAIAISGDCPFDDDKLSRVSLGVYPLGRW